MLRTNHEVTLSINNFKLMKKKFIYRSARLYIIEGKIENQAYYLLLLKWFNIYNSFYISLLNIFKINPGKKNKKSWLLNIINNKKE